MIKRLVLSKFQSFFIFIDRYVSLLQRLNEMNERFDFYNEDNVLYKVDDIVNHLLKLLNN